MYLPLNYNQIDALNCSYLPASVKTVNTVHFAYWERALFQRILSTIDFKLPEQWQKPKDFLLYCLFKLGYLGVANVDQYGLIAQPCSVYGFDLYYQPTNFVVANPHFIGSKDFEIGKDGELLKLTNDFLGVWDIIAFYAERLATLDGGINMSIINSKFPWILGAKNRSVAKTLMKAVDKAQRGEPMIIFDKKILDDDMGNNPFQYIDLNMSKDRFLLPDMLQAYTTIINQFDTEIGIMTVPYEKKERLVTAEAESKQEEALARITSWINTFNNSAAVVNKHFGTDISASLSAIGKGGGSDERSNNDLDRSL